MSSEPGVLLMGGEASSAVQRELVSLAEAWGRGVAGDRFEASEPDERLTDAVGRVLAGHDGPLLVIWPRLARWRREMSSGPLTDLAEGCDLVLGPTMDAGVYLLGLSRPLPGLLERFEGPLTDDAVVLGARAAQEASIEIGLLRVERGLQSPADVAAALADPLTPPEVVKLLREARGSAQPQPEPGLEL